MVCTGLSLVHLPKKFAICDIFIWQGLSTGRHGVRADRPQICVAGVAAAAEGRKSRTELILWRWKALDSWEHCEM